jgi:hypothetical protein
MRKSEIEFCDIGRNSQESQMNEEAERKKKFSNIFMNTEYIVEYSID